MKIIKGIFILLVLVNLNLLFAQAKEAPAAAPAKDGAAVEPNEAGDTIKGELVPDDDTDASLSEKERKDKKEILRQEAMWKNQDYSGYNKAFEDLHKLSKAFANNKYRLALSSYQSGMNTILKMRESVEQYRKEQAEKKRLDEKWYWQKIDRKSNEERYIAREKMSAKLAAVTYFTKANLLAFVTLLNILSPKNILPSLMPYRPPTSFSFCHTSTLWATPILCNCTNVFIRSLVIQVPNWLVRSRFLQFSITLDKL